eukprot:763710-Hanusia_phi.AAC.4
MQTRTWRTSQITITPGTPAIRNKSFSLLHTFARISLWAASCAFTACVPVIANMNSIERRRRSAVERDEKGEEGKRDAKK